MRTNTPSGTTFPEHDPKQSRGDPESLYQILGSLKTYETFVGLTMEIEQILERCTNQQMVTIRRRTLLGLRRSPTSGHGSDGSGKYRVLFDVDSLGAWSIIMVAASTNISRKSPRSLVHQTPQCYVPWVTILLLNGRVGRQNCSTQYHAYAMRHQAMTGLVRENSSCTHTCH